MTRRQKSRPFSSAAARSPRPPGCAGSLCPPAPLAGWRPAASSGIPRPTYFGRSAVCPATSSRRALLTSSLSYHGALLLSVTCSLCPLPQVSDPACLRLWAAVVEAWSSASSCRQARCRPAVGSRPRASTSLCRYASPSVSPAQSLCCFAISASWWSGLVFIPPKPPGASVSLR